MLSTTSAAATRALRLPAARILTSPMAVRAIATSAPKQLANAVTEMPKRREVLLPSQEKKPSSVMQYALYFASPPFLFLNSS
jgi:hypothetical protein